MLLRSGNRAVMSYGPSIDRVRPIVEAGRHCNPNCAPEQSKRGRKSWGARSPDKPCEQWASEIEKPFGADRPSNRGAAANRVDDRIFANQRIDPSVDRE